MKTIQKTTTQQIMNWTYKLLISMTIFAGIYSCTESEPEVIQCSALIDITGSNTPSLQHIKSEDFLDVLNLKHNNRNAIEYRQAFITETFLNFTHKFSLKPAPPLLESNEFDRDEEITAFKNKLNDALALISQEMDGRQYSSVYVPFAREVNRLAGHTQVDKKILLLFSDLTENSDFMSFFAKNFQNDLQESPEVIEEYFQKELPLADNLSGLTIHIVHQPNGGDNAIFKKLSRVYRSMLEKRGATVLVQANLMK